MSTIEERLAATESLLAQLQDQLTDVQDDLGHTAPAPPEKPPPPPPQRWADRAGGDDWSALIDWVDNLIADYSINGNDYITPCWPAHPGVVEELAGIWRAWTAAVIGDTLAGPVGAADLAEWHDRSLWPCLRRLRDNQYSMTNCRAAKDHVKSSVRPRLTDRTLVPLRPT